MEVVGSPRRFDGNAATWDPCEPLMNVFREKVILSKRVMQKIISLPLSKPITFLLHNLWFFTWSACDQVRICGLGPHADQTAEMVRI